MDDVVRRIVVELPAEEPAGGDPVLAAALTLLPDDVEVAICLTGLQEPTQAHADRVLQACTRSAPDAVLPTIDLVGHDEALRQPHLLHVRAGGDPVAAARAIVRVGALAAALRDGGGEAPASTEPAEPAGGQVTRYRTAAAARIRARDDHRLAAGRDRPPLVVAVVQVQSYWPALASICATLDADPAVQLEVVALESEHDVRAQSTEAFVRRMGYQPRTAAWFQAQLEDGASPLSLVLLDNPYDGMRPTALQSPTLAEAGVRVAYSPYSNNNLGAGAHLADMHHSVQMQYDLPLHQLAWRIYVRSEAQRELHARHCQAGDGHVRVLGMPKLDRVLHAGTPAPPRGLRADEDRPVVLYNPHFSFGPAGWSTFEQYVAPMLQWFREHDDAVLLLRPHFRIWRDLRLQAGGRPHPLERAVRKAVRETTTVVLDEDEDYLPGFVHSDAMVSDLSSLITEYVPLRKPVLYLHKEGGAGVNEDATYFFKLDVATRWEHVEAFLEQVRSRVDGGIGRREALLAEHFPDLEGRAGARIAEDLVGSLAAETAERRG